MSRIILITVIDNETNKLVISHGYNEDTYKAVILPQEHPSMLGAYYDDSIGEWVIGDKA
jgi:hypothetical protein